MCVEKPLLTFARTLLNLSACKLDPVDILLFFTLHEPFANFFCTTCGPKFDQSGTQPFLDSWILKLFLGGPKKASRFGPRLCHVSLHLQAVKSRFF